MAMSHSWFLRLCSGDAGVHDDVHANRFRNDGVRVDVPYLLFPFYLFLGAKVGKRGCNSVAK